MQALLDAGAPLRKTITDELACSLVGTNLHYGTPETQLPLTGCRGIVERFCRRRGRGAG